jgi:hypothetical protein
MAEQAEKAYHTPVNLPLDSFPTLYADWISTQLYKTKVSFTLPGSGGDGRLQRVREVLRKKRKLSVYSKQLPPPTPKLTTVNCKLVYFKKGVY